MIMPLWLSFSQYIVTSRSIMPFSRSENFVTSTAVPCGISLSRHLSSFFLTHELRAYLALRLVGYHIVREKMRPFDGVFIKLGEQLIQSLAGSG